MAHSVASFAKIFNFPDRPQLVAFVDPAAEEPTIIMLTMAAGMVATTHMSFNNPEAPFQSKQLAIAKLLELIDEGKARQVAHALETSLNKHLPIMGALDDLLQAVGLRFQPFARLVDGPSGEKVLLIKQSQDEQPSIRTVTATQSSMATFHSDAARDGAFSDTNRFESFMPSEILVELGMSPVRISPAQRKPGPR